ncbi:MAG: HK97-gp10 family putative phage morphogenesis protein [Allobaculum sp.]|uniref:HK97-gp10 family putative phage morphogenesis protein n=1 Tax=Allobaculum sp. TaxID=1872463 RepID=UPI00399B04E5
MKLNVSITGLSKMQKKMIAKANPAAIQKIVRVNAAELTEKAQRKAPVSTEKTNPHGAHGQLRRSIAVSIEEDGMAAVVRAGTEYAEYVEKGTRFMEKQPYVKPAFDAQKPQFLRDLKKEIAR